MEFYNPKCPKCGTQLAPSDCDCFDSQWEPNRYVEYQVGTCPKCKTDLEWKAFYNFSGLSSIEFSD